MKWMMRGQLPQKFSLKLLPNGGNITWAAHEETKQAPRRLTEVSGIVLLSSHPLIMRGG
jgi:hypothetical protein